MFSASRGTERAASTFAVALHMHQPLIPAADGDLHSAPIISNPAWMMDHQDIGDNRKGPDCTVAPPNPTATGLPQAVGRARRGTATDHMVVSSSAEALRNQGE